MSSTNKASSSCAGLTRLRGRSRFGEAKARASIHLHKSLSKRMDCRVKCSDRGHGRHLFGDMTDTFSARQVDGCDLVGGEENTVLAVV